MAKQTEAAPATPVGLFDDMNADIDAERAEWAVGTHPQKERKAATPTAAPHAGGRPRSAQNRVQFTTKPKAATRRLIKSFAAQHDITASDVIDELAERYLTALGDALEGNE